MKPVHIVGHVPTRDVRIYVNHVTRFRASTDGAQNFLRELQSESLHPTARVHHERRFVFTQRRPRVDARECPFDVRVWIALRAHVADEARVQRRARSALEFRAARLMRLRRPEQRRA